jgi:hypothetical protein
MSAYRTNHCRLVRAKRWFGTRRAPSGPRRDSSERVGAISPRTRRLDSLSRQTLFVTKAEKLRSVVQHGRRGRAILPVTGKGRFALWGQGWTSARRRYPVRQWSRRAAGCVNSIPLSRNKGPGWLPRRANRDLLLNDVTRRETGHLACSACRCLSQQPVAELGPKLCNGKQNSGFTGHN